MFQTLAGAALFRYFFSRTATTPSIAATILSIALLVAWLTIGRSLTSLVDRLITVRSTPLSISPLEYDGGGFVVGKLSMTFGSTNNLRANLRLAADSLKRVVLSTDRGDFVLGPRTNPDDGSGRPDIVFVPEAGDQLFFTSSASLLGWPTPFEFNFLGGSSPWRRRYVYYRLVWKKASGAKLATFWRYEQQWYSGRGWTLPAMMWNSHTGLLSTDISPATRVADRR